MLHVSIPFSSGPVLNIWFCLAVRARWCLNPFFFRASAEQGELAAFIFNHVSIPFSSGPVLNTERGTTATSSLVSIPFSSGPVLNLDALDVPDRGLLRLNPFFFRASAEPAKPEDCTKTDEPSQSLFLQGQC